MLEQQQNGGAKRSSAWDVNAMGVLTTLFLATYVINVLVDQTFHTELSPAVPGGLTFEATQGGPFAFFLAGFLLKSGSLAVAIAAMWKLLNGVKAGKLYSERTARQAAIVASASFAWIFGAMVEGMGNNFMANRLGIGDQWSGSMLTNTSVFVVVFLLISILYVLQQAIKDASVMQQEVDGLV
ncbi:DUF2975 domain-containing protein [Corynebacterium sp. 153RC1]|uniref:DUF2975 domain-containing protein n=2 Tax=Corynebacterium TaxID=1716 RepID=UPI00211D0F96|nr:MULTISPECIES: DUF2975 domain-containing protein [unclassified Corynebacterium]MCQ9364766.1 DUF2975 domain-containing protein [Corynebacterium sp. 70RC1]MCQ9371618.1 DUF2975 domain-containing protein [Corynebacterium sp. 35RC1]MCQ9352222.1 DUF2975 domain-containing protein [Corynebacterium sp. 209RC1]MCQ9354225.1 DUF2975 domain-containing protein [Corynebacterium sp. 1222RC1]MCQ9356505.1 DUF2975 domain-containing protein [Corynebacterium sp. 122RC1]